MLANWIGRLWWWQTRNIILRQIVTEFSACFPILPVFTMDLGQYYISVSDKALHPTWQFLLSTTLRCVAVSAVLPNRGQLWESKHEVYHLAAYVYLWGRLPYLSWRGGMYTKPGGDTTNHLSQGWRLLFHTKRTLQQKSGYVNLYSFKFGQ